MYFAWLPTTLFFLSSMISANELHESDSHTTDTSSHLSPVISTRTNCFASDNYEAEQGQAQRTWHVTITDVNIARPEETGNRVWSITGNPFCTNLQMRLKRPSRYPPYKNMECFYIPRGDEDRWDLTATVEYLRPVSAPLSLFNEDFRKSMYAVFKTRGYECRADPVQMEDTTVPSGKCGICKESFWATVGKKTVRIMHRELLENSKRNHLEHHVHKRCFEDYLDAQKSNFPGDMFGDHNWETHKKKMCPMHPKEELL